ncbi:unnamed protein product [Meloidogyne enterolobii]|uniref:Uncharacterized protein n=1 Tax=Meloidogyne enterolobii TaxID=390850 RepID=A0ACB0Y7Y2_MELEN
MFWVVFLYLFLHQLFQFFPSVFHPHFLPFQLQDYSELVQHFFLFPFFSSLLRHDLRLIKIK